MHLLQVNSLVAQSRQQIEDAIINGELRPGERLIEGKIAAKLGTSRGPVREAARLLEQQGLLISRANRGFFVREFDEKEINDLYELRMCIEVAAARWCVARAADGDLANLRKQHRALQRTAKSGSHRELVEAIVRFHSKICALSGNGHLIRIFSQLLIEVRQILSVLGVRSDDPAQPIEIDEALIEALTTRDEQRAADEMRRYIECARNEVIDHFRLRTKNLICDHGAPGLAPKAQRESQL